MNVHGHRFQQAISKLVKIRIIEGVSLDSDECRTKKAFKYVKRMLPLFRAVVK